jgi:hypothetical protein
MARQLFPPPLLMHVGLMLTLKCPTYLVKSARAFAAVSVRVASVLCTTSRVMCSQSAAPEIPSCSFTYKVSVSQSCECNGTLNIVVECDHLHSDRKALFFLQCSLFLLDSTTLQLCLYDSYSYDWMSIDACKRNIHYVHEWLLYHLHG